MAVLAVIGGIDGRLRLGGQVTHDEFGEGTVTRITPKGRITVQFSDMRMSRVCPLNQLKPVGAVVPGARASGKGLSVGAGRWENVLLVGHAFQESGDSSTTGCSHPSVCLMPPYVGYQFFCFSLKRHNRATATEKVLCDCKSLSIILKYEFMKFIFC